MFTENNRTFGSIGSDYMGSSLTGLVATAKNIDNSGNKTRCGVNSTNTTAPCLGSLKVGFLYTSKIWVSQCKLAERQAVTRGVSKFDAKSLRSKDNHLIPST